jgi:hypothetical protein
MVVGDETMKKRYAGRERRSRRRGKMRIKDVQELGVFLVKVHSIRHAMVQRCGAQEREEVRDL